MKISWAQWEKIKSSGLLRGYGIPSNEVDNIVLKKLALYKKSNTNEYIFDSYRNVSELNEATLNKLIDDDLVISYDYSYVYLSKFFIHNKGRQLSLIEGLENLPKIEIKEYKETNFNVQSEMRKEQIPIIEEAHKLYKENNFLSFIIKAAPGVGKTFMSLKLASDYKLKTLIITPNDVLEKQWIESILEFGNIYKDDIGIISGSNLEKLKKELDKDIIVCKVQSLMSQIKQFDVEELRKFYKEIGAVFYDEAHLSGSATAFAHTSFLFETPNIVELTATPFNKGTHDFLMKNTVNDTIIESSHQNLIPNINMHNPYIYFNNDQINQLDYFKSIDYTMFLAKYNSYLYDNDVYFNYIAQWAKYRIDEGHKVVIIFSTNKMIEKMHKLLLNQYSLDLGIIIGKTEKAGKLIQPKIQQEELETLLKMYKKVYPNRKKIPSWKVDGSFNKEIQKLIIKHQELFPDEESFIIREPSKPKTEMQLAKEKIGVISNTQTLSAGYDDPKLSCVLFGSPFIGKKVVIQSLGRITRLNKEKRQDTQAHFFFSSYFTESFPDMRHILTNNIKIQYPTAKFYYEGFK